jgi:hypothetical protein
LVSLEFVCVSHRFCVAAMLANPVMLKVDVVGAVAVLMSDDCCRIDTKQLPIQFRAVVGWRK